MRMSNNHPTFPQHTQGPMLRPSHALSNPVSPSILSLHTALHNSLSALEVKLSFSLFWLMAHVFVFVNVLVSQQLLLIHSMGDYLGFHRRFHDSSDAVSRNHDQ